MSGGILVAEFGVPVCAKVAPKKVVKTRTESKVAQKMLVFL